MLSLGPGVRVFVGIEAVDMRGSFDSLAGAARRLGLDPVDGHLYLFFNRRRRLCKMVWFDGTGWCLYSKRLEAGSFELPSVAPDVDRVAIDGAALSSLLAGIELAQPRRGWYRRAS